MVNDFTMHMFGIFHNNAARCLVSIAIIENGICFIVLSSMKVLDVAVVL